MASQPQPFNALDHLRSSDNVKPLTAQEVDEFVDALDHDGDGYIHYEEIEMKLDQAYDELVCKPHAHHILHRYHTSSNKQDHDAKHNTANDKARHAFLRAMMGSSQSERIPRADFAKLVHEWNIPSLKQAAKEEQEESSRLRRLPGWRRIRAYWAVHAPEIGCISLVIAMQLAFGIWQLVKYVQTPPYRETLGWGVILSKTCAGALYPTFFFLLLSMSRYLSTWLRRSYRISRFFNWDLSQEFHVRISVMALGLATLHAIGHLAGTFRSGSDPANEQGVVEIFGSKMVPARYVDFVRSLPGYTGIAGIGAMYVLSLLSLAPVRRWNYEVFQLGHLLMFPIIGLMMAHGTAGFLQWPMFGYFLAFPTLLVLVERTMRIFFGFRPVKATLKVLDGETVEISAAIKTERTWRYKAGQYVFLQVPRISFFQWHPFTVSFYHDRTLKLHIKADGNWSKALHALGGDSGEREINVGIDGPFGAPAQRFYDFNHSVLIGGGIGVTPFSGILADLQYSDQLKHPPPRVDPPVQQSTSNVNAEQSKEAGDAQKMEKHIKEDAGCLPQPPIESNVNADLSKARTPSPCCGDIFADDYRRVDFHWMVRDRNFLLWISDLLNEVSQKQANCRKYEPEPHLDIRITTHVTAKRKSIVTHVYRWLLEMHRTEEHPASPLTGLLNPTHFGRPDFDKILDQHYRDMVTFKAARYNKARIGDGGGIDNSNASATGDDVLKVGVFYCGAPVVGEILADKFSQLTTRARHDGTKIEYHFMIEVFS